jgi:hypothetical protein
MLNDCFKYAMAINAKGQPFPTEPLIMALLLSQHKLIDWLTKQVLTMEIRKVQVSDLKNLLIYILFQVPSS